MATPTSAQGSLLKIGNGASTEVFNTIPMVTKYQNPNAARTYEDATSHDSAGGFKQWTPGLLDGGEFSADFNFDPLNVTHQQVITDANSNPGTLRNFKSVLPTATYNTWTWSAYISMDGPILEMGKLMKAVLKIRVTGPVVPPSS